MPRKRSALATPRSVIDDRLVLLVELVVEVGDELLLGPRVHALGRLAAAHLRRQPRELRVQVGGLLGRAGDDQRRARLVDQDVVDLVDDRERVVRATCPPRASARPPCWTFSSSDVAMLSRR